MIWKLLLTLFVIKIINEVTSQDVTRGDKKPTRLFEVSLLNRYHKHYCGGAIIRNNWIVTAARCSAVCGEGLMCAVRYGTADINGGRFAPIRIFVPNPNSNIALAEAPLIIQGVVKPVLIYNYPLPIKAVLMAVGWRWDRAPRICYKLLRRVKFNRVSCPMTNTVCATAKEKNVCFGDYGGPLVYQNNLVGISNFGLIRENSTTSIGQVENMNTTFVASTILRSLKTQNNHDIFLPKLVSSEALNKSILNKGKAVIRNETNQRVERSKRAIVGNPRRCYSGYGTFAYVSFYMDWIDQTIREYSEEYGLDTLPMPDEWTNEYIRQNYDFDKSPNEC